EIGLIPILCVGEKEEEREAGKTEAVIERQIKEGLKDIENEAHKMVFAYEPVWAIGTGRAATADGANAVLADVIRPALADLFGTEFAQSVRILYGGSVKANNAAEFFSQPEIDGALVGGASLTAHEFIAITQAAVD
ncbi:MAG: triosephosphate isomerase, partial [Anaerolineales bacterium]|nr:triosephosphate isomerase [Anaerolineales bacterium]